jgi:hypothetical protein
MPHYLIMLFPLATIFTAPYLRHVLSYRRGTKLFFPIQAFLVIVMIILAGALNYYFFKPANWIAGIMGPLLLAGIIGLWKYNRSDKGIKIIYISAAASILFNFMLNYNFFPQLLKYQGGNEMVKLMKEKSMTIPDEDIILLDPNAHSFDFYKAYNHVLLPMEDFDKNYPAIKDKYFFLSRADKNTLQQQGYKVVPVISQADYNIAKVSLKFLNPAGREKRLDTLMLAKIYRQ